MQLGSAPVVGLDIGTSAVRAAQVVKGRNGLSLSRFGQVALPHGAVVDGEIRDAGAVSEAIAQLWKRARLGSKKAVIGIANQGVVVRQVDLPWMEEKEFRSSFKFQVADHIPMPVDTAELDYELLGEYQAEDGQRMMRILLVAAASDTIESFLSAIAAAGVQPAGVDVVPFAIARAVSSVARGEVGSDGSEAIVDVGAGVTNILVHHNSEVRFVRILLVGGDETTTALMDELDLSFEEAEAVKLDLGRGVGLPQAQQLLDDRVDRLVSEIRGSLDYYLSQEDSEPITSLVATGGGALTPGLVQRLEQAVGVRVTVATPLGEMDCSRCGLTTDQVDQVEPVASAAVGLAMGTVRK